MDIENEIRRISDQAIKIKVPMYTGLLSFEFNSNEGKKFSSNFIDLSRFVHSALGLLPVANFLKNIPGLDPKVWGEMFGSDKNRNFLKAEMGENDLAKSEKGINEMAKLSKEEVLESFSQVLPIQDFADRIMAYFLLSTYAYTDTFANSYSKKFSEVIPKELRFTFSQKYKDGNPKIRIENIFDIGKKVLGIYKKALMNHEGMRKNYVVFEALIKLRHIIAHSKSKVGINELKSHFVNVHEKAEEETIKSKPLIDISNMNEDNDVLSLSEDSISNIKEIFSEIQRENTEDILLKEVFIEIANSIYQLFFMYDVIFDQGFKEYNTRDSESE